MPCIPSFALPTAGRRVDRHVAAVPALLRPRRHQRGRAGDAQNIILRKRSPAPLLREKTVRRLPKGFNGQFRGGFFAAELPRLEISSQEESQRCSGIGRLGEHDTRAGSWSREQPIENSWVRLGDLGGRKEREEWMDHGMAEIPPPVATTENMFLSYIISAGL